MAGDDITKDWFSDDTATFGDRLAGAREKAGLSQRELAERLGVKLTTLRHWEDDLAAPRANRLQMLAGMLSVSLTWLLTAQGDGIEAPVDVASIPKDVTAALSEIRALRQDLARTGDKLEQLERRLRQALGQAA